MKCYNVIVDPRQARALLVQVGDDLAALRLELPAEAAERLLEAERAIFTEARQLVAA